MKKRFLVFLLIFVLCITACSKEDVKKEINTPEEPETEETAEELYKKAKDEDILVVYTVSTRTTQVKEAFEKEYPGLLVEIRDLRSPDLIEAVEKDYNNGSNECDVVICTDNSGDLKSRLVDTGIVLPYLPSDIKEHLKNVTDEKMVPFVYEAQIVFYNTAKYQESPEKNLWALTKPEYKGRIYMPNPVRSFSTYAFCGSTLDHDKEFEEAYREYFGSEPELPDGMGAAKYFWTMIAKNMIFTNSSDEVAEALADNSADFGFMVSSKLRLKDIGYGIEPVYGMEPFAGCRTSYSVMLASGSKNKNCAKLFIRYLLGEADGKGEGYKPFNQSGTWSARNDVEDATPISLDEINLTIPDIEGLISQQKKNEDFWTGLLKESAMVSE